MDFAIQGNGGNNGAALRAMRGADPLLTLPPGHILHRVAGVPFQAVPGALHFNAVNASIVEAVLMGATYFDGRLSGAAMAAPVLRVMVRPAKLDAVMNQLYAEPAGIGLDQHRLYSSLSDAAADVCAAAARLDTARLHPAYIVTPADLLDLEPIAPGAGQRLTDMCVGANALTFRDLVGGEAGFATHAAFLYYCGRDRCLSVRRDAAGSVVRKALSLIEGMAEKAGCLSERSPLTGPAVVAWLNATTLPAGLQLLRENGSGETRREQLVRDRHALFYGDEEQRERLVIGLVAYSPLKERVPNLLKVIGRGGPEADIRSCVQRLAQHLLGKGSVSVVKVSILESLEAELKPLMHALASPTTVMIRMDERVALVAKAKREMSGGGATGTAGDDKAPGGGSQQVSKIKGDVFAEALTEAFGSEAWTALDQQISAALERVPLSRLKLYEIMMKAPFVGVRRAALGLQDSSVAPILRASQGLTRALMEVDDWCTLVSNLLVCDLASMTTANHHLQRFRLQTRVVKALKRGGFNELDWVTDVMIPVLAVKVPDVSISDFGGGLRDPLVMGHLLPLLRRISLALGLPVEPMDPHPQQSGTAGQAAVSLCSLVATVSAEAADIMSHPSPFVDDDLEQLALFESTAWSEAAEVFHREMITARNPVGAPLVSILAEGSAALSILAVMRANKEKRRSDAHLNKTLYAMQSEYRRGKFGERFSGKPERGNKASPAKTRDRSRSPSMERSLKREDDVVSRGRPVVGENPCRHSNDRSSFWFASQETGRRVSPVYDYGTLEKLGGKSRTEVCYPFLLSNKPPHKRMSICERPDEPGHQTFTSAAHVPPTASFLDQVYRHFAEPVGEGSSSTGVRSGPTDRVKVEVPKYLASPRSPHPADARRSHGLSGGPAKSRSASPVKRLASSRSASPIAGGGGAGRSPEDGRSRSASPNAARAHQYAGGPRAEGRRSASPPIPKTAPPSPRPSTQGVPASAVKGAPSSSRGKRQRTPGVRQVVWGAAAVAAPASANAMAGARASYGPEANAGYPLLDVSLPCEAAVRTLLFVVSIANPDEALFYLPSSRPSTVVGSVSPLGAPRYAAVEEARRLAQSLPLAAVCRSLLCLPVFESVPAADDVMAVVDRVVAIPLPSGIKMSNECGEETFQSEWAWVKLSGISCVVVYALAATVVARLASFSCSIPARVARVLGQMSSQARSGARPVKSVKASAGGMCVAAQASHVEASGATAAWRQAIIRMRAADEALRNALLAVPEDDPMSEDLRAFADTIRPIDLMEVPPAMMLEGAPPDYRAQQLRLLPFSTRVKPPRTQPLSKGCQLRQPDPDFNPKSISDLLRPEWMKRVVRWYEELGEWLVRLSEVAHDPDSQEAEEVRRARPRTLVVPRSGFVEKAVDIIWDLTGDRPVPLDFDAPIETHLDLQIIKGWQAEWPDYPDKEIFSHLLDGVRFKVELPYQMVLQPHLASLSYGFVNVHKELLRLIEKGYFSCTPHPPFVPWRTLPSGSVERKQEPGRPRRTEDGAAPRKGHGRAEFMVDRDGVRTLSINLAASIPADDLRRGTHAVFYDAWERRLARRYSPRPASGERAERTRSGKRAAVLLLFSGDGRAGDSLAAQLINQGLDIIELDIVVGGEHHDMADPDVQHRVKSLIGAGRVSFLFAAPPCESGSIAPADSRPRLRSPSQPWGVTPVPKRWLAYLDKHNALVRATAECICEAARNGVPWMIENPALRTDPQLMGFWSRFKDWGTLWHCFADLGIAPAHRSLPQVEPQLPTPVHETLVAACSFGAEYQKLTMLWSSNDCAPLRQRLEGKVCNHASHSQLAHGIDENGSSRARASAKYPAELAAQLACGIAEVVAIGKMRGAPQEGAVRVPAQPQRRCARCKRVLIQCDRCHQWCCDTTGCFYVKCLCDLPEYAEPGHERAKSEAVPSQQGVWSAREPRVTCSDRPAPPALRMGTMTVDVNITLESSTPSLANPFLMGKAGKDESLRDLAASTYVSFLAHRTVRADECSNGLRVATRLRPLTGEMVLREVERIVARHPAFTRFHLVCRRSCTGKACHGRSLCLLFDDIIQSTRSLPFPKEVKPTIPEVLADLAVLKYLSHHTGIPVIQIVSDVKDFFNQHALAPSEKPKVGLVTVDPRAIVEYVKQLRAACPELCSVLAHVLGYGLTPASNVCQRTAHLLTFVWLARMEVAARAIVAALSIQHPFLARWLAERRRYFGRPVLNEYDRVSSCQARLWTMSMYTDDGHQALLGVQLAVCGLRVWREITGSLKLQMAIIQKHGLGQQVTVQGVVVNTGLGVAYVPTDKMRRALATVQAALDERISIAEYRSLVGLLQSLLFVAGMDKTSMYGMYAPLSANADPDDTLRVTPWLKDQLAKWHLQLRTRAGSSFWCALPRLRGQPHETLGTAPAVFFIRSDASKEGVGAAGLGGALGGLYWRYPESGPLDDHYLRLPIAALEFIAYVGSVAAFAHMIPEEALLVSEVDALATADTLTAEAARSPVMQTIHLELLQMPAFARIAERHVVAHIYGEANVVADAVSRDLGDVLRALAGQLGLRLQFSQPPACVSALLDKALGVTELAATSLGMHNPTMTGTPFAQAASMSAPWTGNNAGGGNHGARIYRGAIGLSCGCVTGSCQRPAKFYDVEEDRVSGCESCEVGGAELPRCDCDCGPCRPWLSLPRSEYRAKGRAGGGAGEGDNGGSRDKVRSDSAGGEKSGDREADAIAVGDAKVAEACAPCEEAEDDLARSCDCATGRCARSAVGKGWRSWEFAFCAQCSVDESGVRCTCDCGRCHPEGSIECEPKSPKWELCLCPSRACIVPADYFEPEIQRPVCAPCGLMSPEGVVCTCDCVGCRPLSPTPEREDEKKERPMCACARIYQCENPVRGEGERCSDCSAACSSDERCACPCVACRAETRVENRRKELIDWVRGGAHEGSAVSSGPSAKGSPDVEAGEPIDWRSEEVRSVVWRGQNDWLGQPGKDQPWRLQAERVAGSHVDGGDPARMGEAVASQWKPMSPPDRRTSGEVDEAQDQLREAGPRVEGKQRAERTAPVCLCRERLVRCGVCGSLRCNTSGCWFIKCICDIESGGVRDQRSPGPGGGAGGRGGAAGDKRMLGSAGGPKAKKVSGSPGPAADKSVAETVSEMLAADASGLALNLVSDELGDLCRGLYDTSTAQPERTTQAQTSAWEHWVEWCSHNHTSPWRLVTPTQEVERQREAVLMAGFLRFCHRRQSQRPRDGRPAALVASATKALSHIRKLHREKGFPMQDSALVLAQARRLQLEYKAAHGVAPLQPRRKEPFTRKLLVEMLLLAPDGADLGNGLEMRWDSRFGRSFAGLVTTLVQTGFRKGEVTVDKKCDACPVRCLSRSAVAWYLGGQMYSEGEVPTALLLQPRPGDYVVLTPGPSKSDQLGLVWGGTPIWIPFVADEPLCAFPALAQIEMNDKCGDRQRTALFTYDDGTPLVSGHMDRVLHRLLSRELPEKTVRLYSWHSARIFLATALRASGASMDETQALCRWQTPTSLRIYARMNRERYGALIARAMRAEISSARAGALADAMPFLDLNDTGPVPGDQWSGEEEEEEGQVVEGERRGLSGEGQRRPAEPPQQRSNEAPPARAGLRRQDGGADGPRCQQTRSPAGKKRSVAAKQSKAEALGAMAEERYGRVPYFPDNLEGYQTFFERPSARRPPNARGGDKGQPIPGKKP